MSERQDQAPERRPRRPRRARRARRPRRPRRTRRLHKPRRPPRQLHPTNQERAYARILIKISKRAQGLIDEIVIPQLPRLERMAIARSDASRTDGPAPWIGILAELFETVRARMSRIIDPEYLERLAGSAAEETADFNKEEMTRQMRAAVGVDIFLADPGLRRTVAAFVEANVALIKTIPAQLFDKVERVINAAFRRGQRSEQIAPRISHQFGVSYRRARFIARDQIAKINGQLTEQRQTELGLDEYIWRTSRDERVRESHRALEGTVQKWSDPPTTLEGRTVHPGEDYQCRCTAEPVIPGIAAIKTSPANVPRDPALVAAARARRR